MDTHGELALLAAIDAGGPVATNAAQAAELERLNGAKHAAKVITCKECGHLAEQSHMHHGGHPLPICVDCKAKADAEANGLAVSLAKAFAPLSRFPAPQKDQKAIKWAREQLSIAGSTDALTHATDGALVEWLDDIYRTMKTGRFPAWMLEAESHECPTCEIDCVISEESDGPSDTAKDVPCATCPLCQRQWYMTRGEWEAA